MGSTISFSDQDLVAGCEFPSDSSSSASGARPVWGARKPVRSHRDAGNGRVSWPPWGWSSGTKSASVPPNRCRAPAVSGRARVASGPVGRKASRAAGAGGAAGAEPLLAVLACTRDRIASASRDAWSAAEPRPRMADLRGFAGRNQFCIFRLWLLTPLVASPASARRRGWSVRRGTSLRTGREAPALRGPRRSVCAG
jgi:hypothetical protein